MDSWSDSRVLAQNRAAANPAGDYVLYWMTMARRPFYNFALERAAGQAARLGRPLLVLEALRLDYPWASQRPHAFILQGMADNQRALAGRGVLYYPYVEPRPGQGRGLLAALAKRACLVVADYYPCFFLPRMLAAAARALPVRLEAVDGCGLLPLLASQRDFPTAYAFRRHLQKTLPFHLMALPAADPLEGLRLPQPAGLDPELTRAWPAAPRAALAADQDFLDGLELDASVPPAPLAGGWRAGQERLRAFLPEGLAAYDREHSQPGGASGLSPYLHFGHVSPHQIFLDLARAEGWSPQRLSPRPQGRRQGWWGLSPAAEAFLDQLVTWRELGFNMCRQRPDYDQYASLPVWALASLAAHAGDQRPWLYGLEDLAAARTHDELWNAAQRHLLAEGVMPGYLRMLWGKKILEWSPSPQAACAAMIELNNRHALDGRDPNSYSGIFWILGRYDRPFARRAIFGQVRYMSSASARRKLRLADYLTAHAPRPPAP